MLPLIYADFNGMRPVAPDKKQLYVSLAKFGTKRDLERQHIDLREGLPLRMHDDEEGGIVASGAAHFDPESGKWVAVANASDVRYLSDVVNDPNHWASTVDWSAVRSRSEELIPPDLHGP